MELVRATDWRMIIDGQQVEAAGGAWTEVRSPASGGLVGRVPCGTGADVETVLQRYVDDAL